MSAWKNLIGNSNLIQAETAKAYLIKLPKSELMFWHPAKLVKLSGKNNYRMSISYTNEFKFKCFRKGKSGSILEERELDPEQLEKFFGIEVEAENAREG